MSSGERCPDLLELRAYLAGTHEDSVQAEISRHLHRCAVCQAVLREMDEQRTEHATDTADRASVAGDLPSTPFSESELTLDLDDDFTVIESLLLKEPLSSSAVGRLGKYDILSVLGRGGMGVVLCGYDAELRREVAIKTLNRTLSVSTVAKRRFMREARAAAAISHPNVVTIYSVDQHLGMPFIVMERLHGPTLAEEIKTCGRLDPIRVVRISAQIASGLAAAHLHGVIHRDIKPGNVMLEKEIDRCKITDFGLARATIDNVELTSRELAVGTPAYMSPEQVTEGDVDTRSDLFSQGSVMYAMLVGHSPFHGRSAVDVIRRVERCTPADLRALDSGIPEFLCDIVMRLLRKNPDERFQSSAELADVLNRHLSMINQTKSDPQGRIPISQLPLKTAPRSSPRRRRAWATLGLVGLGILVSGIVWAIVNRSPPVLSPENRVWQAANLTVSQGQKADFTSIAAAIRSAGPGTVILVTDDATYVESIRLTKSDVTLKSSHQATIRAPDFGNGEVAHAVELHDCRNVTLEGFNVVSANQGYAVYLYGTVEKILLRNLTVSQIPGSERCTMRFSARSGRADSAAVTLEDCEIDAVKFPCLWLEDHTAPTNIKGCLFLPAETAVGMWGHCGSLQFSGSIVRGGMTGVNAVGPNWSAAERFQVVNNSFDGTHNWLGIHSLMPASVQVEIANNFILDSRDVEIADSLLVTLERRTVFRSNFWQVAAGMAWVPERMGRMATQLVGDQNFVTRDYEHPEYLKPLADSVLATSGVGGELPSYVGAIAPSGR
ncbi:MAG: protein kinase domain-containing protein [Pirellulaceae bacterium]